ncbi:MAG TPA: maleylacetoacetate isomerase [Solimonas sp.]|nr:maleylacetoacetate isomerase [Solimonas sp.]
MKEQTMLKLYTFWRSSASYRVRIALNLKGLPHELIPVNIVKDGGAQYSPEYRALNPQSRVPLLLDGDFKLNQSLAILEYLEELHPQPSLLPHEARRRARMWAFCHTIAGDIQPLQNLGPLAYLTREFAATDEQKGAWLKHWIERGLSALEEEMGGESAGAFTFGDQPTLAECVLVPQLYAAARFGCDATKYPRLAAIGERCNATEAFAGAHPERQPDRPT